MQPEDVRLEKTEKARGVLASTRASGLGAAERRILILADGRRSLADIAAVLGTDILPIVQGLVDQDYLARARPAPEPEAPPPRAELIGERLGHLLRGASLIRQARPRADTVAPATAPHADDIAVLSGSSRASPLPKDVAPRSIISAKTHAVDLLGLHSDSRLVAAVEAIRQARGEADVARAILDAVAMLRDMGEPQLLSGAIALLDPLMPEPWQADLQALDPAGAGHGTE
ncbi:hypothetical protein [Lysobacter brunescens]|uniref:Uncharacterized protein n=1 Tax=Lysobacter brunescens TaxID=262323 RepID=A0ABW2Y8J6_9GAMM